MAVTYVIRFDVVPEKLERFMHLLNGVLDAMRTEPNFHEAVLHRDPDCAQADALRDLGEPRGRGRGSNPTAVPAAVSRSPPRIAQQAARNLYLAPNPRRSEAAMKC
jgi:hypothetical protein